MYGYHIVAVYPSLNDAKNAKKELIRAGVNDDTIHLSSDVDSTSTVTRRSSKDDDNHGFFHWLFGDSSSDKERDWYATHLQDGKTAVSVLVAEDDEHLPIAQIMIRCGGLDLEDESAGQAGGHRSATSMKMGVTTTSGSRTRATRETDDEVIPMMKEELSVGKKTTENRYRVRAHVVERPVEESIELRDERVIVERRPVSRNHDVSMNSLRDREYEVIERHEEPVVQKKARAVEEVVVRKDSKSRTETVRDTVRETEVEVDGKRISQGTSTRPQRTS